MTQKDRQKICDALVRMEEAYQNFDVLFSGAGRDTDLRDELLKMQWHLQDCLAVFGLERRESCQTESLERAC